MLKNIDIIAIRKVVFKMLPTFSVNADSCNLKGLKIAKELERTNLSPQEREWASEAYIKVVEGKSSAENVNLSAFSKVCEANSMLKRVKSGEVLLSEETANLIGYEVYSAIEESADPIAEMLCRVDIESEVEAFIDDQDYILRESGKDLWWLLKMAVHNSEEAQRRLRMVLDEFDTKNKQLRKRIEFIIKTPGCYSRIKEILG